MALKGWAELVHEQRLKDLALLTPDKRKKQIELWIKEDGIDSDKARQLWGNYLNDELDEIIARQVERHEREISEADRRHRYEYEVINIEGNQNANEVINAYAREGWRLHTFSLTALDAGAFTGGFMKAFGGPGVAFTNVLTLVFERER